MKKHIHTILITTFLLLTNGVFGSDILVVVDSSGSMQEKTTDGITRIEAAKSALLTLPGELENHDVGLMLFGHRKSPKQPGACSDIELRLPIGPFSEAQYKLTVAALQPRGATPIANALMMAGDELMDRDKDTQKSVILVTDGNETCGGKPIDVAAALQKAGFNIAVHVVGFGVNQQQEVQLRQIAAAGGGEYILASNARELSEALPNVVKSALRVTKVKELSRSTIFNETFDNENLSDTWTILRHDDERIAAVDGELLIVSQYSADMAISPGNGSWHNNKNTKNLLVRRDSIDANDYEISVDLDFKAIRSGQGAALQLRKDDKNVIELALVGHPWGNNLVRRVVMNKLIDGQAATVRKRLAIGVPQESDKMALKIVKRGIEFTGYYKTYSGAAGNSEWIEAGRQAAPGFDRLYPTLKTANGYTKSPEATATFDNFVAVKNDIQRTVENDSTSVSAYHTLFDNSESFQRDFDTSNANATHFGLNGGLNIVSQSSAPDGQKPKPNMILLNKELPQGNYEIEIQASTRITSQNPDVGIALYESPEKGLYFGHAAFGGGGYNHHPQFQFEKVLKGERTGARVQMDYLGNKDITFLFKIVKTGRKYNASVYVQDKKGEMQWVSVGEQSLLKFSPRLGFYAWNRHANTYGNGPAHEINVKFERVVVRSID